MSEQERVIKVESKESEERKALEVMTKDFVNLAQVCMEVINNGQFSGKDSAQLANIWNMCHNVVAQFSVKEE